MKTMIPVNILDFYREDYFDIAYSVLTFHHIDDKKRALQNIVKSVKTGGTIVLSLSHEGEVLDYQTRKVRLYPDDITDFKAWFKELRCEIDLNIDLIDDLILPNGRMSNEYGEKVATLLRAKKI